MARGRVLVIEDEPMVQILIEDICEMAEVDISAVIDNVAEAKLAIEEGDFNAVILDVNLLGETSEPLAELLRAKHTPVVVTSGSYAHQLPEAYAGFMLLEKPFSPKALVKELQKVAF